MPTATLAEVIERFNLDDRLTLCDVWQKPDGSIAGFVEMPQYRDALRASGFDVTNVKLMPEEGATTDRFGIVTAEHAILRKFPKDQPGDRDNATDVRLGELVWILDEKPDGWLLVHASDGYLGWAESDAIRWKVDAEGMRMAVQNREYEVRAAFGSPTSPRNNISISGATTQPAVAVGQVREEELSYRARELRELICNDASSLIGTPYVWGGKTSAGIDCSGLVQTSFARHRILLPRDADQQANVGRLVATRWFKDALLPGDLLFFINPPRAKISHVAIYLGAGKYIEAAGKDVHVSSMTPADTDYDAERAATFAWARRVIE